MILNKGDHFLIIEEPIGLGSGLNAAWIASVDKPIPGEVIEVDVVLRTTKIRIHVNGGTLVLSTIGLLTSYDKFVDLITI
jgi:hypothetical protein